jgi:Mg-chelatase subunit ChlD
VIQVEHTAGSANVVLVIDSSGSMGSNMEAAVAAAKRFVESLPENSSIAVVQFAQAITEHPGTTKSEALAALDKVKAGGATSLYDATALALTKLQGKERPYVVVFSDGADSREPGISGDGSKITLDQLVAQVGPSGASVLTIGFGAGHDPKALIAMSNASPNGGYFVAADKDSLDSVFAVVSTKFGNQYIVTYERPTAVVNQDSDVPVVSVMMDASGSMDMDPSASPGNDVDYRLDRVKNILHKFILDLPRGTLMQFNTFFTPTASTPRSHFLQLTTDQKALILRGIASVQAGGGTPIVEALNTALLELTPIPSNKKVLVFMTDAALSVKDDGSGAQQAKLDEVLAKLKKAGIRVLFTGLGGADYAQKYDAVFKHAADVAGGEYVITANVDDIAAKLSELLAKINTPAAARTEISLAVKLNCLTNDGSRMSFAATKELTDFSTREATGKTIMPGLIKVAVTDEKYVEYDREASQLLYGSDSPTTESIITMRLPFTGKSGSNAFSVLTVSEAYFMETFQGIKAPTGQQYLALKTNLAFKKADAAKQETGYCIPSIFQHFYVSCNKGRMMPASEATWLTEQPFANPGESSVTVADNKPCSGMLVFMIDKPDRDELNQLSLHLYDTDYGHINLPLVGGIADNLLKMGELPKTAPADITETFALSATGLTDLTDLAGVKLTQYAKEKNTTFRVLEASFASKVQALLNIDPMKRFYYAIETDSGLLMTKMSDVVGNLPFGFTGSTMLAPASANNVRLPFVLPNALLNAQATLYGDIRKGNFTLPLNSGAAYATASARQQSFEQEYFTFTVNSLVSQVDRSRSVVLDFTVTDKKDGMGTSGFDAILNLELKSATAQNNTGSDRLSSSGKVVLDAVNRKGIDSLAASSLEGKLEQLGVKSPDLIATRRLIFGASEDDGAWGVFDGQSRRGILIFTLPGKGELNEWVLTSS